MKGLKIMLLGFAFLLFALMGTIMNSDFGFILFVIGSILGLIFCIYGCFDKQLSAFFKNTLDDKNTDEQSSEK